MVGTNTALKDNPALTTRLVTGNNPVRLVIDMDLKLPALLQLFDGSVKTMVFNTIKQHEGEMVSFHKISKEGNLLQQVLRILYQQKIQSVIIEGGAKLLQSFIDANLWDEARVITNTEMTIGNGIDAPGLKHTNLINEVISGTDKIGYFLNSGL